MPTLALNIYMCGRLALVIGGGRVALRKVQVLLAANATIHLVSPAVCPELSELAATGSIFLRLGRYAAADLDHAFLVVAATNDAEVNQAVAVDAEQRGILVSVVDNPSSGNCTFPALLRRKELEISVSTGGRCPTLATNVRDIIAGVIGEDYGAVLEQVATAREKLLTDGSTSTYNSQVLRSLAGRLIAEISESKDKA